MEDVEKRINEHGLRLQRLEDFRSATELWKEAVQETVSKEIPDHYRRRIKESEQNINIRVDGKINAAINSLLWRFLSGTSLIVGIAASVIIMMGQ